MTQHTLPFPGDSTNANVAMTCVNEKCARVGYRFRDGRKLCLECGSDLFPYDDVEWQEDNSPSDHYDPDGTGVDFQTIAAYMATLPPTSPPSLPPLPPSQQFALAPTKQPRVTDTFTCPSDLTGCPIASRPTIRIPLEMYQTWVYLAKSVSTEWIAYLKGTSEGNTWTVDEMYFPPQRCTPSHCEAEDGYIEEGTIAAVHSHVGMDVFFSGEDVKHMNHAVELVVNRRGDLIANGRTILECGRAHRGEASIILTPSNGEDELVKILTSIIKAPKATAMFDSTAPMRQRRNEDHQRQWRGHGQGHMNGL